MSFIIDNCSVCLQYNCSCIPWPMSGRNWKSTTIEHWKTKTNKKFLLQLANLCLQIQTMLNWANVFCFKCVILVYIERFPHFTNKRISAFYFFYGKKIHVTVVMSLEPEMWSHWCGGVHLGGVGDGAQVPGAPPLGRMSGLTNILWMKPLSRAYFSPFFAFPLSPIFFFFSILPVPLFSFLSYHDLPPPLFLLHNLDSYPIMYLIL